MAIRIDRDKNLLAYKGSQLVRVLTMTESGAIAQYELVDSPGIVYMPLIKDDKNVDEFVIVGEQTTLF